MFLGPGLCIPPRPEFRCGPIAGTSAGPRVVNKNLFVRSQPRCMAGSLSRCCGSFDLLARRGSQAKWPVRGLLIQRDGHLFSVQSEVFVAPWGSFDSLARRRSQAKWPRGVF